MKENDEIERLFSSAFEGAEMLPPDSVKTGIDKALFGAGPAASQKSRGWIVWSVLSVALISFGTFWLMQPEEGGSELAADDRQITERAVGQEAENEKNEAVSGNPDIQTDAHPGNVPPADKSAAAEEDENSVQNTPERTKATVHRLQSGSKGMSEGTGDGGPGAESSRGQAVASGITDPGKMAEAGSGSVPDSGKTGKGSDGGKTLSDNAWEESRTAAADQTASETVQVSGNVDALAVRKPGLFALTEQRTASTGQFSTHAGRKPNAWELELYAGPSFGYNTLRGDGAPSSLKEQNGMYASLEALYPIAGSWSVSAGIDFGQRRDQLSVSGFSNDSVFAGNQEVIVYDSTQVPIDTLYYPIYDPVQKEVQFSGMVRQYSIGIPIYVRYKLKLAGRLGLDLAVGARFSYMKYTNESEVPGIPYPDRYRQFGINASFRPELVYRFPKMAFGLYGRFEYDFMNGMEWNAIKRTRLSYGLGLCLRYKL